MLFIPFIRGKPLDFWQLIVTLLEFCTFKVFHPNKKVQRSNQNCIGSGKSVSVHPYWSPLLKMRKRRTFLVATYASYLLSSWSCCSFWQLLDTFLDFCVHLNRSIRIKSPNVFCVNISVVVICCTDGYRLEKRCTSPNLSVVRRVCEGCALINGSNSQQSEEAANHPGSPQRVSEAEGKAQKRHVAPLEPLDRTERPDGGQREPRRSKRHSSYGNQWSPNFPQGC